MPWFPTATRRNIPPGTNDPRIVPTLVVLHVAVTNADSLYDYFNGPSGGIESHFYVRKDGSSEQYRNTDYQADAQYGGNDFAVSIETQGLALEKWTAEQLATIKAIIVWANSRHPGIRLVEATAWNGTGVGYHSQFAEWNTAAHSCPGPHRIRQYNDIIVPWLKAGAPPQEDTLSAQDVKDITAAVKADGDKTRALVNTRAKAERERDAANQKRITAAINSISTTGLSADEVKTLAVQAVADALAGPQ